MVVNSIIYIYIYIYKIIKDIKQMKIQKNIL